jgi:hypothetical protein
MICGNSVFGGYSALQIRGLPRRNLIARLIAKNSKIGLWIWGIGPENIISNSEFINCDKGVEFKENPKGCTLLLSYSSISSCKSAGIIKANGLAIKDCAIEKNKTGFIFKNNSKITELKSSK